VADHARHPAADVSDGLVEAARVPLSDATRTEVTQNPELLATVLTGGEDYEILLTAALEATKAIVEVARSTGIPITRIGRMVTSSDDGCNVSVNDVDGRPLALPSEGWTHF